MSLIELTVSTSPTDAHTYLSQGICGLSRLPFQVSGLELLQKLLPTPQTNLMTNFDRWYRLGNCLVHLAAANHADRQFRIGVHTKLQEVKVKILFQIK